MLCTDDELKAGRHPLAATLGYSPRRSNDVLRELDRKGYISFIRNGAWRATEVVIERKAIIPARGRFIRI